LFDAESWGGFVDAVKDRPGVGSVFVVTNSTSVFQQVAGELPDWVEPTMLYEDYLSTFEINTGSGD
jgi:wyosine [tRNA(Phe)-imidazoG37] synthetase (radical SAM superfamily)